MAEFIVRVKRVQISYADIAITAEDVEDAGRAIENLAGVATEGEADWLGGGPGDWEVDLVKLSIEEITDEDGHSFGDVDGMRHAALDMED